VKKPTLYGKRKPLPTSVPIKKGREIRKKEEPTEETGAPLTLFFREGSAKVCELLPPA